MKISVLVWQERPDDFACPILDVADPQALLHSLFARVIADAVEEGRFIANKRNPAPEPPVEPCELVGQAEVTPATLTDW